VLKKVTLENFQAHKYLELTFDKFTTLTGGSNGGKSAVLRAILALVRNDSATDYLRHGQKTLSVKLEFEDRTTVEWVKGSGENRYTITNPDGTQSTFDKVGANVPEEVSVVLKLGPVVVGQNDKQYVNFHTQLEQPFLISSTPGDVAKLLGELTSASQLYTAVNEGNKTVRSTNAQKTVRMGDLRQIKIDLEEFDNTDEQEQTLSAVFEKLKLATRASVTEKALEETVQKLDEAFSKIPELEAACQRLSDAQNASLTDLLSAHADVEALTSSIVSHKRVSSNIETANSRIAQLDKAVSVDLSSLVELSDHLVSLESAMRRVVLSEGSIAEVSGKLSTLEEQVEQDITRRDELMRLVDDCPHCGMSLTDEARGTLLSNAVNHAVH
jgi:DNA repair ATPase RecN